MLFAQPDFNYACDKANEILICSNTIKTFPFSGVSLIQEMSDIVIQPYSLYVTPQLSGEKIFGSKDAAIKELDGMFMLFYNDTMPRSRRLFSACHEFGHYYLNHDLELLDKYRTSQNQKGESLYAKYEVETNFFAAQLLMPEQVLIELFKRGRRISIDFLQQTFGVSEEAAKKRIETMKKVYNWNTFRHKNDMSLDDIVLTKFKSFIDCVAPRRTSYSEEFELDCEKQAERENWLAQGY